MSTSFDLDQFIADCRAAREADPSHKLVREVVARAVADPAGVFKGLGEPKRAEIQKLYQSDTLTILNVIWAPKMTIMPHDHRMWAVIGVYSGREDNIFWRRLPGEGGRLEAAGAKALSTGDTEPLGHNIIHSVTNPISRLTGAIHVYGGDFFRAERSEWDPETLLEERYNVEKNLRLFEEANAGLRDRTLKPVESVSVRILFDNATDNLSSAFVEMGWPLLGRGQIITRTNRCKEHAPPHSVPYPR